MIRQVIKPDSEIQSPIYKKTIFLAGTIEMGKSIDWQSIITEEILKDQQITFYNPRINFWDQDWKLSIDDPHFSHQVNWEQDNLESSKFIFFNFLPDTISPISLLELGQQISTRDPNTIIVCCPDGYLRKGNVDIVCKRKGVKVYTDFLEAINHMKEL